MPLYNTSSTATALQVSHKWLDNLLSHNKIAGVFQERQGVPRRVAVEAVMTISVARVLTQAAGVPNQAALELAAKIIESGDGTIKLSPTLTLTLDIQTLRRQTITDLAHAVEVTPHPARGRPRGS